jgi:hypothetical protein
LVGSPKPQSGAPQAQGLTAIRLAEAQLAVPSGEALPAFFPRTSLDLAHQSPTNSAGEPFFNVIESIKNPDERFASFGLSG